MRCEKLYVQRAAFTKLGSVGFLPCFSAAASMSLRTRWYARTCAANAF
jgi:hypothetical protein